MGVLAIVTILPLIGNIDGCGPTPQMPPLGFDIFFTHQETIPRGIVSFYCKDGCDSLSPTTIGGELYFDNPITEWYAPSVEGKYIVNFKGKDIKKDIQITVDNEVRGRFYLLGRLNILRILPSATLLNDGRILIAGGLARSICSSWCLVDVCPPPDVACYLNTAEIFDPYTGQSHFIYPMNNIRGENLSHLLQDTRVLILDTGLEEPTLTMKAEIFSPVTESFRIISSPNLIQNPQTTLTLPDGKVWIANEKEVELFDPISESFTLAGTFPSPRTGYSATLLTDGTVLISGGDFFDSQAFLYSSTTMSFLSAGNMVIPRMNPASIRLSDGKVLVVCGRRRKNLYPVSEAEIYDPSTKTFSITGTMSSLFISTNTFWGSPKFYASQLSSGKIIILGSSYAEVYDPMFNNFTTTGAHGWWREWYATVMLNTGTIAVIGGMEDLYKTFGAPSPVLVYFQ